MAALLLAGFILIFVLGALAVFARGGAGETVSTISRTPVTTVDPVELEALTRRAIGRMGLQIDRTDPLESDGFGFLAIDPAPYGGGRVYVRTFARSSGERASEADIQRALDAAKDEAANKLILISPAGFTDDAILAARETIAELIDGEGLAALATRETTQPAWKRTPSTI
jgi:hypothetical protein